MAPWVVNFAGLLAVYVPAVLFAGRASLLLPSAKGMGVVLRSALAIGEVGVLYGLWGCWVTLFSPDARLFMSIVAVSLAACLTVVVLWVRHQGLVAFMGPHLRKMLLETSMLEWIRDPSLFVNLAKFKPLFLNLSKEELQHYLEVIPPAFRERLLRKGLVHELPPNVQTLLLPQSGKLPPTSAAPLPLLETPSMSQSQQQAWRDDITHDIVIKRLLRTARKFLLTADPPLTRILTVASIAAVVFRLGTSRGARHYSLRVVKHGSMIGMMAAAFGLSALAVSQVVADKLAERPLSPRPAPRLPALLQSLLHGRHSRVVRRAAMYATPAMCIAVMFFLMQLRTRRPRL